MSKGSVRACLCLLLALEDRSRYSKSNMPKQSPKNPKKNAKVDYEPNKVGLAVASVAVASLVLIAVIVMY